MEFRRSGRFRVSAFASVARADEDTDAVIRRLLTVSELSRLAASNNDRYYMCTTARDIQSLG